MPDKDHELERGLSGLADGASRRAELPDPSMLRRTAEHRKVGSVVASVAAVAVVVAGGYAWLGEETSDRGLAPASSPTSPAGTTAPSTQPPTPTSTRTETADPKGGWVTTIPAGLPLPHEGTPGWGKNPYDNQTWLLSPCLDIHGGALVGYRSDDERTDWRSISARDAEDVAHLEFEQLGLYPDDAGAAEAMRQMRDDLARCAEQSRTTEYGPQQARRESFWGTRAVPLESGPQPADALHAYNWNRWYDAEGNPTYGLGGPFITVVRVGNAILLVGHDGETDFSNPELTRVAARQAADDISAYLPELCVFAPDGHC